MTTAELYVKGAGVWVPDPSLVWKAAVLAEDFKNTKKLEVAYEDGSKEILEVKNKDKLPPLRNPQILIGENDLTSLSYLHEPAVLYNLQVRFVDRNAIYTYCGIVLVAINPYEQLPIYGLDTIMLYRGQAMGDLDPHIFAVAEEAYTKMEREERNQSIIVSGESGAGKTVSAKYAMRYFATVGGSTAETNIEKKVLASNPIMEAIGNAKTTRNDNSSRFGKYIEINFNKQYHIIGANMRTYLLEKSRVVFQAPEERNYHIFYQLCASFDQEDIKELQLNFDFDYALGHQDNFLYTNQGESPNIHNIDDAHSFEETRSAFKLLGFDDDVQMNIFRILAAVLHFGNVNIIESEKESDQSRISKDDNHLSILCKLLAIDEDQMRMWLCRRKFTTVNEVLTKPLSVSQAMFSRDALAKHIYAQLFNWIVAGINKSLAFTAKAFKFIGVLDIYGFETFEINSFEQFCINYANEKLQQQFNQHVFKLEQEEYMKEAIEWSLIDFYDNQPCIDLIESKLGILDLLDEECKMPKGTDGTWCQKLFDKCKASHHFEKPRLSNTAFIIHHFADNVQYECGGFLEKNRDTVIEEQLNILKASQIDLVVELFAEKKAAPSGKSRGPQVTVKSAVSTLKTQKTHKKTVGSQFRDSLTLLMETLNATTPQYVRCIKPNDQKLSFTFDPKRAIQQLRACGVLETIRISAAGYPSRWTYVEFFNRYRVLSRTKDIKRNDMKTTCLNILEKIIKDTDKYKFGKTKIFFRAGQVAYLEKLRSDKMRACCILIQKHVRGWLHRNRYQRMRWAAIQIQRYIRGFLARRLARFLRRTKAAICIQRYLRGYYEWKKYQHIRRSIISLQSYARGMWARQHYVELLHDAKATIIQKCVRGWLARLKYQKSLKAIVLLQSCVRRMYARRELKKLKIEARSVEHVKKLNQGLENKIISLQQKMDQLTKENNQMKSYEAELIKLKNLIDARGGEAEMKRMSSRIDQLEKEILTLRADLLNEQTEKEEILNEKEKSIIELQKVLTVWNKDTAELKEKLCQANETIKNQEKELEEIIISKSESEKMLHDEFESERVNYQKILKDYARLEQRFENLQSENQVMKKQTHQRTPSNLSTISIESTGTEPARNEEMDNEDLGYGSTRSMRALEDQHKKLENVDWSIASQVEKEEKEAQLKSEKPTVCVTRDDVDIGLVLKLQQRIKELQDRNKRLEDKLENKDDLSPSEKHEMRPFEALRIQDLEMENAKLKDNFNKIRSTIETGNKDKQIQLIVDQHSALEDELERRRDECLQLRTLLANKSLDSHAISKEMYGGNDELINEDGELYQLYHAQRQIIRQLEKELQGNKVNYSNEIDDLRKEMGRLKEDNERQQKLIGQHLQMSPEAKTEAIMQHEITRLTGENLDLQEKADEYKETIKQLKKRLKIYAKKLKDGGTGSDVGTELERRDSNENMPAVKHKEVNYLGMFEYKKESEPYLIKSLIIDLKPSIAVNLLPGLPAYILFMCIRHTDYINDDEKVRSLLTSTINGIKRVIKKKHEDFEIVVLWLTNICRLLHNLKQYSGDKTFQVDNTPKQNEQCLRNFDLSEYRQILSDIAVWIYQGIVKIMEETIQPFVVAAILEHEAIAGLSGKKPLGMRGRSMSTTQENTSPTSPAKSLDSLNKALDNFYDGFIKFGSDPEIISQIFRQIFYFICAGALNNLLLRKDLCHWSKGMQMRYNCSHMEQWLRDHKLQECGAVEQLSPIIQASQLLQARKTDEDVDSICDMCDKLTLSQIIKMLNLYTPADVFEERVPVSFIRKIQAKLQERGEANPQLLMDTKHAFPVRFPFNPSNVQLEDIEIPESLNISFLKKI